MRTDGSGDPRVDSLDEEALANYLEAHNEDDSLWQKHGRKVRARRGPSTVFQMRIAPEELEEIARAANGNISDFVRTAALEKARGNDRWTKKDQLREVRKQLQNLTAAVEEL
jgi:hypothetical protein